MSSYWLTVSMIAMIYAALALAYNIAVGYVGMLAMSHAASFGVGAYVYALWGVSDGSGAVFLPSLLVGFAAAAALGVLLGTLLTWLPREYVVMVTFSVQLIFTAVMMTATDWTRGPAGVAGIPIPEMFGIRFQGVESSLILTSGLLLITLAVSVLVLRFPLGMRARMTRDDPVAAEGMGVATKRISVMFFALSAGLAGMAGVVFAGAIGYVDPTSFTVDASILVLSMVAIGGLGNPWGVLVGGLSISFLPQLLLQLNLSGQSAAAMQQIFYGLILIGIMVMRPVGLIQENSLVPREGASR